MEKEIAVVAEGGGQRGIFTAGILDTFLESRFNPFDLACGVSAGAQNLLAYFLEQHGFAKRAIAELTSRPDFLVPYRWLAAQSILDLDGYFETTLRDPEFRLPYQQLDSIRKRRCLQFVATDRESLDAVYLEPDESTVLEYMKASSAVPFLYKSGVRFGNRLLVDGGVADPLPVQHAYQQGAKKILVIRTVPQLPVLQDTGAAHPSSQASIAEADNESMWRQRLLQVRRLPGMPLAIAGKILAMLECHEAALGKASEFMRNPPADLTLVVVSPRTALKSYAFGSRSEALLEDYQTGRQEGRQVVAALRHWQSSTARTAT